MNPYLLADPDLRVNAYLPIPGHAGYFASISDGTIWKDGRQVYTYLCRAETRLYLRCVVGLIHRAVMAASLGRQLETSEQVCHVNGNGLDNRIENLRIGTAKSNALDKIAANTNGTKLRNQDVREIRFLAQWMRPQAIGRRYGISRSHVAAILSGRSWFNLPV